MESIGIRMGEFPRAQVGVYDFRGEDFAADSQYFGLQLHETILIAHLKRVADGIDIHITRPFMLYTSTGFSLSYGKGDGGIYQDGRAASFLRGGNFSRTIDGDGRLVLEGGSGFWSGGLPLAVEARIGDRFDWIDSGRMKLSGRLIGPALQTYVSTHEGRSGVGVCHTGVFFEAEGEVLGEAVSGILIVEHVFSPPGKILADSAIRRRFAGGWNGFATVFEDGSSQHGHIAYGAGPFRFANIMDGDRHIACGIDSIATEYDPSGLGRRIEYRLSNGEVWEFVTEATMIDMLEMARAAGSDVRVHKGWLGRVGEQRARRNWYSIQEWVPDRMIDNPPEAIPGDVPRAF